MKYISIAIFIIALWACNSANSLPNLEKDAQTIAKLQCEAKHLKDERFKFADKMNIQDDSLLHIGKKLSILQEKELDFFKTRLYSPLQRYWRIK